MVDPATLHPSVQGLLRFFEFEHLREPMRSVSKRYSELAYWTASETPSGPEQTVALRKLLEAKDCAVRSSLSLRVD